MKKVLTIIFDGFGMRDEDEGNAIKMANMHNFNMLWNSYPHTTLYASEERIGLLKGQMGNSEVGHMTIGGGRIIKSNMDKIADFLDNISENQEFNKLIENPEKRIHIMGLCSDGNIHASIDNILRMYNGLVSKGMKNVFFHVITDGRDTKVDVSYNYIKLIEKEINKTGIGKIATICGRYYAMDRDSNFDRTKIYYDLITRGIGQEAIDIGKAINSSYERNITDEFIKPIIVNKEGLIRDKDAIVLMNFRTDRVKQILYAFDPKFNEFSHFNFENIDIYTLFPIDKNIKTHVFIEETELDNPLGIYLSKLGLTQARIAESEKYPHVTYFFDGGFNGKIDKADKYHIPSPEVATYDLKPEMSAVGVTRKIIECMEKDYDFIFANFANGDMVGHTGNLDATVKACLALDVCLGKIIESAEENFYTVILLADHGNADTMINPDGSPCTTHSLAKVPFIITDNKIKLKSDGDLTNVAPTILDYMDISIPLQMTSDSLLENE